MCVLCFIFYGLYVMKNISKILVLSGSLMLASVFAVSLVSVTNGAWIDIGNIVSPSHIIRLTDLYLSTTGNSAWMEVWNQKIRLLNWMVVYSGTYRVWPYAQMAMIWWWDANEVRSSKVWIVWWYSNKVMSDNSVIGGWRWNVIDNWSTSVIAWWIYNTASWWVIVWWWENSVADGGSVVLWGTSNSSQWENGLVLGSGAKGADKSFSRNDGGDDYNVWSGSARIDASNGLLIWTYQPRNGINLVISGAIRIWKSSGTGAVAWEIMMSWWCFYAYDGEKWYVLGKDSVWSCGGWEMDMSMMCRFGSVLLQEWDRVTAYSTPYSPDCDTIKNDNVYCTWWQLVAQGWSTDYIYPNCYAISGVQEVPGWNIFTATLQWSDSKMNSFKYSIVSVDRPEWLTDEDGPESIVIMDRNLWATTDDITSTGSYGYKYQWWNNYWFANGCWTHECSDAVTSASIDIKPLWNSSYDNSNYSSSPFVRVTSDPYDYWWDGSHDNLWWWASDWSANNRWANETKPTDRRWPCPVWYHVPSAWEWWLLIKYWAETNNKAYGWDQWLYGLNAWYTQFEDDFNLPFAWWRGYTEAHLLQQWNMWFYRSSSPYNESWRRDARNVHLDSSSVYINDHSRRGNAYAIRCFRD